MIAPRPALPLAHLHAAFLAILPGIERHGRAYFGHLLCQHRREDAIAEMVALGWKYFLSLVERDKDPTAYSVKFANYTARHVRCGRRLCGQGKAKDVLCPLAQ
jgi:hypothetical protein